MLKTIKVLDVPINGMNNKIGRNVPKNDPRVEIAYTRPEILPASVGARIAKRIANGEIVPNRVIGTLNRINTPVNEPNRMAT
jgi:hypothetical protein